MSIPKPCPPARRIPTVLESAAHRSGLTVLVRHRQGVAFWAVARSVGQDVTGILSGTVAHRDAGRRLGHLHEVLDRAARRLRTHAAETLYCAEESAPGGSTLEESMVARGLPVRSDYAPAPGMNTATAAIESRLRDFYRRVVVSTDASAARRGWTGTGWVIDFGHGSRLRLGHQSQRGSSILEAELRAILLGTKDALSRIPHGLESGCHIHVRSDSTQALDMIAYPDWRPSTATQKAGELADAIRHTTRGLQVRFTWVKGHDGDLGNETADRLAVMSRRHAEHGLDHDVMAPKVEALRQELEQISPALALAA